MKILSICACASTLMILFGCSWGAPLVSENPAGALSSPFAAEWTTQSNVVIVGWDAVQWDHFKACYDKVHPDCPNGLPNLLELTRGRVYPSITGNGASVTKPGWAQLLTGYNVGMLGILDNNKFRPIPEGWTIFEKIKNQFGADQIAALFLSGKDRHLGGDCSVGMGEPWCITKTKLDYYEDALGTNEAVGQKAMQLLEQYQSKQLLAFFHFPEPDWSGHQFGENSPEYHQALLDVDQWLGRIMDKLKSLGIYENTAIYVISDHGFGENLNNHWSAPYTFWGSNDPIIARAGNRNSFAPTLLKHFGISLGAIGNAPPVQGIPLDTIPEECVHEGSLFVDYPLGPRCCVGLTVVSLDRPSQDGSVCAPATGGLGNNSGHCVKCGDGICKAGENKCNCPTDCK